MSGVVDGTTAVAEETPPMPPRGRGASRDVWVGAAVAAAVALFAGAAPLGDVVGISAVAVAAAIVGVLGWRTPAVRAPLFLAFALRTVAALTQAYVTTLPGSGLDAVGFEAYGWAWSRDGWRGLQDAFKTGAMLYSWVIAVLYWITTRSPLLIQMVNVLLGTLVVYNVFRIARLLWGEGPARRAAWIAAWFPTLVLFSAITLRELMVGYPLTLGALWVVRWRQSGRVGWLAGVLGAFGIAIAFHTAMLGAMAYLVVAVILWAGRALARGEAATSLRAIVGLTGVVGLLAFVILTGWGGTDPRWWLIMLASLDPVRGQQAGGWLDRTDYLRTMVTETPIDLLWQLPIRTVFFLYMPFPWFVRAVVDLVGLVDAGLYAWLSYHLVRGFRNVWRMPAAREVFFLASAVTLLFALVVSNYGTAIRHRGKIAPLLIAVAASAFHRPPRGSQLVGDPTAAP